MVILSELNYCSCYCPLQKIPLHTIMLFVCHPKFCISIVFSFSWGHFNSQEKLKTMLMQNFGVTNKEHYDMLWYFWSGQLGCLPNTTPEVTLRAHSDTLNKRPRLLAPNMPALDKDVGRILPTNKLLLFL